ncbi:MAG TPA: M23 family metallopeptidase [Candidatus Nanopelagicales bacterium]
MRRSGTTGRRARPAALVAVLALLAPLSMTTRAVAMPLRDGTVTSADYYDDSAALARADAHDEADVAALGNARMPEWMAPVEQYDITARFGDRGRHWTTRHTGLDFKAPWGTPVYAVHDGTVVKLAWHHAYGWMVLLEISPGVSVWYCHLSAVTIEPGPVHVGQQLGRIGTSGNATGPHLHLEVRVADRPTDPQTFLFDTPGVPGTPPSWLPPVPIITVANLATLTSSS